jgi:hypothetical protein
MAGSMKWVIKIREVILIGQNGKKGNKTWNGFWAAKNCKIDSNGFLFKNSSKHMQVGSCFIHLIS